MSTVTEFTNGETCTATIHVPFSTGGAYSGPLHIGHYTVGPEDEVMEIWIEQEGRRVQFDAKYLPDLIKQLRRTLRIAQEKPND